MLLLLPRSELPITPGELLEKSRMTEAKVEQILETLIHKTMVEDFEAGSFASDPNTLAQSGVPPALPGRQPKFDDSGKRRNSLS